jgi:hypothetical protein
MPVSRFPGYRPIAVVEIGRSRLGVNFRTPVSRKPSVRSASNFGSLLPRRSPWFGTGPTSIRPLVFELGKGPPNFRLPLTPERVELSSRRLRISGRTAGPVVFAKFGDPRSIGRASFGGSTIFGFADWRRVPMTGCRPLDPFSASAVGGVDRGPSATHVRGFLRAPRWLSPAVGPPAPIASCGGRACNDGLLPLFVRPKNFEFLRAGGPARAPAPSLRCLPFAAPSLRDSRLRATPRALSPSIRGDF